MQVGPINTVVSGFLAGHTGLPFTKVEFQLKEFIL